MSVSPSRETAGLGGSQKRYAAIEKPVLTELIRKEKVVTVGFTERY